MQNSITPLAAKLKRDIYNKTCLALYVFPHQKPLLHGMKHVRLHLECPELTGLSHSAN